MILNRILASAFNAALGSTLAGNSAVSIFDIYGLLDRSVADPAAYGFSNVTDACGALGAACDPSSYLFWDGIHPTSGGHAIIADGMLAVAAVPEPSSLALLAGGLVLLAFARRKRA